MKIRLFSAICICVALAFSACKEETIAPAITPDAEMEKKIDKILSGMTLEEKVGQMAQITITVIQGKDANGNPQWKKDMLDSVISKYKVGSILNVISAQAQGRELT
ncbi:MAG: hypothetical protein IIY15_06590, partial [Flavobacteriales bacterium]|nr:hypothetical protein [Flavobacteriales bacterium]